MKTVSPLLVLLLFLAACGGGAPEGDVIPAELEAKKTLLREKQAEMNKTAKFIAELEAAIIEQDPTAVKAGVLVTVETVAPSDFASYAVLQGSVVAEDLLAATSEIGGRVLQMTVKEGDAVQKGRLIAVLDIEALQKQRAELETALELAKTVFERQRSLWEQNIGSEIQFLQAKNNKERVEKSLASLDVQLSRNKVYAPGSGIVDRVIVKAGELASPGMPIVQILNTSQLKVVADVPENYIRSVKQGERVTVGIPALGLEHSAPISLIGKTVDPANRTFKVEVKLPNDPLLKPNLLAEMRLQDFQAKGVITLPLDRIQQEVGGRRYVMLKAQDGKDFVAKKAIVEIGQSYDGTVVITSGLKSGDEVIMEGARGLSDGQRIEISNTKTQ